MNFGAATAFLPKFGGFPSLRGLHSSPVQPRRAPVPGRRAPGHRDSRAQRRRTIGRNSSRLAKRPVDGRSCRGHVPTPREVKRVALPARDGVRTAVKQTDGCSVHPLPEKPVTRTRTWTRKRGQNAGTRTRGPLPGADPALGGCCTPVGEAGRRRPVSCLRRIHLHHPRRRTTRLRRTSRRRRSVRRRTSRSLPRRPTSCRCCSNRRPPPPRAAPSVRNGRHRPCGSWTPPSRSGRARSPSAG